MHIIAGCLAFLVAFALARQLHPQGILFYQGVACAVACALAQVLLCWRKAASHTTVAKDALLTLLLAYAFMFTVPTTVDRSYSVQLLQQLASHPGGMSRTDLEDWFTHRFVAEGGVERRLREQLATGSLREDERRFLLTERGQWLAASFRFMQRLFNCGPSS